MAIRLNNYRATVPVPTRSLIFCTQFNTPHNKPLNCFHISFNIFMRKQFERTYGRGDLFLSIYLSSQANYPASQSIITIVIKNKKFFCSNWKLKCFYCSKLILHCFAFSLHKNRYELQNIYWNICTYVVCTYIYLQNNQFYHG